LAPYIAGAKPLLSLGKGSDVEGTLKEVTQLRNHIAAGRHSSYWNNGEIKFTKSRRGTYYEWWQHTPTTSSVYFEAGGPDSRSLAGEPLVRGNVHFDTQGNVVGSAVMRRLPLSPKKDRKETPYDLTVVTGRGGRNRSVERATSGNGFAPLLHRVIYFTSELPEGSDVSKDIALGFQQGSRGALLERFATTVGASMYTAWMRRGIATKGDGDPYSGGFQIQFKDALERTVRNGGRIKFNLTGFDVKKALAGAKGWTNWELREVLNTPAYRAVTEFYRQDALGNVTRVGNDELRKLGLITS
jgi:hypothetical protein